MFEKIAVTIVYKWLNLSAGTRIAASAHFFIYDTLKILSLLLTVVFFMGIINSYFPVNKIKRIIGERNLFGLEYLFASFFGAATPFCSCSSVPLFIGFVRGGIPLGITFAFLITSPLVNEVAIALFIGLFGLKITFIYVTSGVFLGAAGGFILGKLKLERFLSDWVLKLQLKSDNREREKKISFSDRLPAIISDAWGIVRKVVPYVFAGIGLGAVIHGYIPEDFFTGFLGKNNPLAVPLAVFLAVPLYSGASGILPVVQALVEKGVSLGTAIAFMMAVVGLSLPEAILLKKVMKMKLLGIFFGTVTLFIIFSGYVFNFIL
jgi:uncharacterized membrane protein YraQ (UPF0718 family)